MRATDISEEITTITNNLEDCISLLKLMRKATIMDKEVDECYTDSLSALIYAIGYQISNLDDLAIIIKREDETK